jgi:hypothetical protein
MTKDQRPADAHRYCGRDFSPTELGVIVEHMATEPKLNRAQLSRRVCDMLNWRTSDGKLKDMSCRVAMLRMQADGLIELPASRIHQRRRRAQAPATSLSDPQSPLTQPVHELPALRLEIVQATWANARLSNEYVARYHELGFTPLSGSQMRYAVFAGDRWVALLSFGASAWRLASRDAFIGWSDAQRSTNLQRVVNNARFLILPWVTSKGLASKALAMAARRLPADWQHRYGDRPVLLETFVQTDRHKGTCYRAANWIHVGQTIGRGKKALTHQQTLPIKDVWLYPLRRDYAEHLRLRDQRSAVVRTTGSPNVYELGCPG